MDCGSHFPSNDSSVCLTPEYEKKYSKLIVRQVTMSFYFIKSHCIMWQYLKCLISDLQTSFYQAGLTSISTIIYTFM